MGGGCLGIGSVLQCEMGMRGGVYLRGWGEEWKVGEEIGCYRGEHQPDFDVMQSVALPRRVNLRERMGDPSELAREIPAASELSPFAFHHH